MKGESRSGSQDLHCQGLKLPSCLCVRDHVTLLPTVGRFPLDHKETEMQRGCVSRILRPSLTWDSAGPPPLDFLDGVGILRDVTERCAHRAVFHSSSHPPTQVSPDAQVSLADVTLSPGISTGTVAIETQCFPLNLEKMLLPLGGPRPLPSPLSSSGQQV